MKPNGRGWRASALVLTAVLALCVLGPRSSAAADMVGSVATGEVPDLAIGRPDAAERPLDSDDAGALQSEEDPELGPWDATASDAWRLAAERPGGGLGADQSWSSLEPWTGDGHPTSTAAGSLPRTGDPTLPDAGEELGFEGRSEEPASSRSAWPLLDFVGTQAATSTEVPASKQFSFPYVVTGLLTFFTPSDGFQGCTASFIGGHAIWTAAHCLEKVGRTVGGRPMPGEASYKLTFYPAIRDGRAPFGGFPICSTYLPPEWRAGNHLYDYGGAILLPNRSGDTFADLLKHGRTPSGGVVNGKPLGFTANRPLSTKYLVLGYPSAPPYNGARMRSCKAEGLVRLPGDPPDGRVAFAGCDFRGGSSGGPWITNDGALGGNISGGVRVRRDQAVAGPYFNKTAKLRRDFMVARVPQPGEGPK